MKVAFDVIAACALCVVLAPLFIAISLCLKLDGGPVLFRHERIGRNGRRFVCLKFRSMVTNPDEVLRRYLSFDQDAAKEWASDQKLRHDPRVTRIGRFLRATSLDELPQLFNVLRLEMSLVGPRPIVENEIGRYGSYYRYYTRVRPGLTGLWQISGRSNTTYQERVELDTRYVKNWRLVDDLIILITTVPKVIAGDGAH